MRRRLQFFLIRQARRGVVYITELFRTARQPLDVLSAFFIGAQIRWLLVLVLGVLAFGTTGYMVLEGWTVFDSFYMTMITISTVGFGEARPLDIDGQLFTVLLIVLAVTLLAYGVSGVVDYIATGQLLTTVAENRRESQLSRMENHFIVAGYGRVGREVALALQRENMPFVIVEEREAMLSNADEHGFVGVLGSATEDEILQEAGIARAMGIICATGSDATNVYIVLSARGLNKDLLIISRASDGNSEAKLRRAGADRVISPYILSGRRMANLAVRPFVVDFLDVTGYAGELEKTLEEIVVENGSILENRTIGEADLGNRTGALIVALYRATGELLTNPRTDTLLETGTRMIVLGTRDALDVTEALAANFMNLSETET